MKSIKAYDLTSMTELIKGLGQSAFRAKQIMEWLYIHNVSSYDEMTNLPKKLRDDLASSYRVNKPTIADKQVSADGTRKYVLTFEDNTQVEAVGMPSYSYGNDGKHEHLTVCFSTQAGCAMECKFCATGEEGFQRNLEPGEMVDQILAVQNDFHRRVTNVVAMGQGEPFQNYDNVLSALRILNDSKFLGIGARHITVSTCGLIKGIVRFSEEPEQFTLAISLHSAIQSTRNILMPRVTNQNLKALKNALESYLAKTNRRITFEYLLIEGINDDEAHLDALISYCKGILCHINLLPMNSVAHSPFQPTKKAVLDTWVSKLSKNGIETTVRNSRGADIDGACGQLKNKLKSKQ